MPGRASPPTIADWLRPQVVLQIIGFLGLVAGAYMSFDGRIANVEKDVVFHERLIAESKADLKDMNRKLDRLIERENGR